MENNKGLRAWQITMLALGTVVGGSFFLGSAVAVRAAGPAIILSYLIGGFLVYLILFALSEMTVVKTVKGSFRTYAEMIYGPLVGFVVGWVYWTGLVLAMSSEAIAVSILIKKWFPFLSAPLIGLGIILLITIINLFEINKLSKIETALALLKLSVIIVFIIMAFGLVMGFFEGREAVAFNQIKNEDFFANGFSGIAGSMLIVIFSYAGFEITGLAASEAVDPQKTVPKAIKYTVISLVFLYIITITMLLLLIPTNTFSENTSPLVASLLWYNFNWAGEIINLVLITAIISTMLAATFGIGQMIYSLAKEGHAPNFLKDKGDIPYRGIIFSGFAMVFALGMGYLLPQRIYLFLVSSGGFSLLFVYLVILLTHYKFRKKFGCPKGKCALPAYPYTSWVAIFLLISIIVTMPLIPGQGAGLVAGLFLLIVYLFAYFLRSKINFKFTFLKSKNLDRGKKYKKAHMMETAEEMNIDLKEKDNDNN